jgi:hypothetical protein
MMVGSYTDDLAREVATQAVCGTVESLLAQGFRPVQGSKRTDRRQRSTEQAAEVVSSDEIRKEQSPDGETPGAGLAGGFARRATERRRAVSLVMPVTCVGAK